MAKENWDIQFIKPCRPSSNKIPRLSPAYTRQKALQGRIVQVNLDNCSLQRMETLTEKSTMKDVEAVGLLPLIELLKTGLVSLTAIGVNEMPDCRVGEAHAAFERFCRKFWPGHKDDLDATYKQYDPESTKRKLEFRDLSDGERCVYGGAYISILQMQSISHQYPNATPQFKFEIYLHSMVSLLEILSAFELEIAKWVFWKLDMKDINQLSEEIKQRRKDFKDNFGRIKSKISKCREFALDAAMDVCWLTGASLSEDLGCDINIDGTRRKVEHWLGTNDHKLYRISQHAYWIFHDYSRMRIFSPTRDKELQSTYWRDVDRICNDVLIYRQRAGYKNKTEQLRKIDLALEHVEGELIKNLDAKPI